MQMANSCSKKCNSLKREKMKNNKLFYLICSLFAIVSVFLLVVSEEIETILGSIAILLMFGGGGVCFYVLEKKGNKDIEQEKIITITDKRSKMVALILLCLSFVFFGYLVLPFNNVFNGARGYTPVLGYIVGITCILFFGFGFITSVIRLTKPSLVMQISDEGLMISKGFKNRQLIAWKDIKWKKR